MPPSEIARRRMRSETRSCLQNSPEPMPGTESRQRMLTSRAGRPSLRRGLLADGSAHGRRLFVELDAAFRGEIASGVLQLAAHQLDAFFDVTLGDRREDGAMRRAGGLPVRRRAEG